jgi:hypothetical protein
MKGNAITLISAQKKRMVMNFELKRATAALGSSRSNVGSEKRVARAYIYLTMLLCLLMGVVLLVQL